MGRRTNTAVWMEKHNRWQIKVQKDGIRKTFYSSTPGKVGQREANQKADNWLDGNIMDSSSRAQKLFDAWLEELKINTSRSHWGDYDSYWRNWIAPKIGRLKMVDITEQHLQSVINAANKKGLSYKTQKNIRACMTAFIKYGRKCKATNLIIENVYIPKDAPTKEKIILQPEDITKLFENDYTKSRGKESYEILVNAWRFEVITGLRPGEVIGLHWDDIDGDVVRLRRSINKFSEQTSGKNENAQRSFALTPLAKQILNKQKIKMLELGLRSGYVFPYLDGDHINPCTYLNRWKRYRDYHGLSKSTLYGLRHTFVSMVKTLPEGVVKGLVGHSVDMDTFGVYGHEVDGELKESAALVQDRFQKILGVI